MIVSFVFENIIEMNGYYLYKNCNNNCTWPNSNMFYYMSHKDWELPNSWIWLTEIDIESGLDFPI